MSNSAGGHARVPENDLKKTSTEVWRNKDPPLLFFRISAQQPNVLIIPCLFVAPKLDEDKFIFKKLDVLEFGRESQNKIFNRFAVLENFSDSEDINRAWKNIKGDITSLTKDCLGPCERKQHKP